MSKPNLIKRIVKIEQSIKSSVEVENDTSFSNLGLTLRELCGFFIKISRLESLKQINHQISLQIFLLCQLSPS